MISKRTFIISSFLDAIFKPFASSIRKLRVLTILALTLAALLAFFLLDHSASKQANAAASKINMVKLLNNGQDADRFVLLVAGEGYTGADRQLYYKDIDRLITNGLLGHDVFAANKKAFNLYVAETWSKQSGPSAGTTKHDTAFDITFSDNNWAGYFGNWPENKKTMSALDQSTSTCPSTPRVVIVLVNTFGQGHGAETLGNYVVMVSTGDDWKTMQHEFGHAIADLLDEYIASGPGQVQYKGIPICDKNASTMCDRYKVPWSSFLDQSTPVPTPFYVHPKNGIGVYVGGATYAKGTYRPSLSCRMSNNDQDFCAYCKSIISAIINSHSPDYKPALTLSSTSNSPVAIADAASKTFDFKLTKNPLLHNENKPLPLADISIDRYANLLLNIYDNKASQEAKTAANKSALLRSAAPLSKTGQQKEFVRLFKRN